MHAPPVEALQDRCFIPTTAVCTPRMCLRKPAVTLVSPNRWGLWEPVLIMRLLQSFNSTLKREVLQDRKTFANPLECRREVFRWCARYNTSRSHSWCGYQAPNTFEKKQMYRVA